MNFNQLRRRVERAERLVQGRADDTQVHWHTLRRAWREGWTAPRIVVAGLVGGFLAGKLEPAKGRAVAGQATRWVQLFSTVSGMFTAMQAQAASQEAERAGDHAERAADTAAVVATGAAAAAPVAAREAPAHAPHPAEAATELSER
ncbi:protein sip-5 [Stenotrophomonas sp. HITSZ_GD]|uniref:protein sip-5 n=1 Tax=Stenotrophomonas sp. HITSZ_GD TaxID=3037248 RepID=UPI00240DE59D|nr:protein sip-5 [Stenotrophomonas sp. HITSZ_GD]MDG2523759.1 protein sip-5 [Stenotrophomonas sp. HITSZ_GD]